MKVICLSRSKLPTAIAVIEIGSGCVFRSYRIVCRTTWPVELSNVNPDVPAQDNPNYPRHRIIAVNSRKL